MHVNSVNSSAVLTSPIRLSAMLVRAVSKILAGWSRACEAQYLAERYLMLSDAALAERGTNREAIISRIRSIVTEPN